ncbi:MAG: hypothetical protein E6J51_04340 [Chloroflexi bacterium]|nr:MAG: hypothetical protein E6J51_04340 [Chloroflexota bacterium]
MPELPELEVLREYLGPRLEGRKIAQVWTSPKLSFLLRTPPDEYARQLVGGIFERVWRRGKFLVFDISGQHLVINPMLGGRGGVRRLADDPRMGGAWSGCSDGLTVGILAAHSPAPGRAEEPPAQPGVHRRRR